MMYSPSWCILVQDAEDRIYPQSKKGVREPPLPHLSTALERRAGALFYAL